MFYNEFILFEIKNNLYIPTSRTAWFMLILYAIVFLLLRGLFEFISPNSSILYGPLAERGNYLFMPCLWIIYGLVVSFVGVKINIKKRYVTSGVIVEKTKYIKTAINKHTFFWIPIQYLGFFSLGGGLIAFIIQILYKYNLVTS